MTVSAVPLRDEGADLELLRARAERLAALVDIGRVLESELDLDRLLRAIMGQTTRLLDAGRSTLFLLDEANGQLWSRVAQGEGMAEIRIPSTAGIAGYVATSG